MRKEILMSAIQEMENLFMINGGGNSAGWTNLGIWYRQIGDRPKSMQCFKNSLDIDPTHSLSYLNLGNHFFLANDYKNATLYYEKALASMLCSKKALEDKKECMLKHELTALATNHVIPIETHINDDFQQQQAIHINLGQAYRQRGMYYHSLRHFEEALRTVPLASSLQRATYLANILAVKSLGNIWKEYEYSEVFVFRILFDLQRANRILMNSEYGVDPYTVSLIRYAPAAIDRFVSRLA